MQGEIARFASGSGYVFPKSNCVFHVIMGGHKPWEWMDSSFDFRVLKAPSNMPVREFIEQVGALDAVPPSYPRHQVGVTETYELGEGKWAPGTTITLGDRRADLTLADVGWTQNRGEAGRGKPVTIAFYP